MGINPRMGGLVYRVIMDRRSPRHKERCLFIGKRSKWAIVHHGYKAIVGDASARVHGEDVESGVVAASNTWGYSVLLAFANLASQLSGNLDDDNPNIANCIQPNLPATFKLACYGLSLKVLAKYDHVLWHRRQL
jgi:hypothetical protein